MKKVHPPADPEAYLASLRGWRRSAVESLRKTVRRAAPLEEMIKWGHLVYHSQGPVLLIRAERNRVLFGFWRGQRLGKIEPRLKPSGMYEMATVELTDGTKITPTVVRQLTQKAVALNKRLGDPRLAAKRT